MMKPTFATLSVIVLVSVLAVAGGPADLGAGLIGNDNIPTEVVDTTATTTTSSGGCFPPSLVVDLYTFASLEVDALENLGAEEDDLENCTDICREFRRNCREASGGAKRCLVDGGSGFAATLREQCRTEESREERDECVAGVNGIRDLVRSCVKDDHERGKLCCDIYESNCLAECLDTNTISIQACFTGPSGLNGGSCFFGLSNSTTVPH